MSIAMNISEFSRKLLSCEKVINIRTLVVVNYFKDIKQLFIYLFIRLFIYNYLFFYVLIVFSVRSCSSLSAPQNGYIYPHLCTFLPVVGTVCHFECRHGFSGNGGVSTILCGSDGNWTKDESSILQCLGNYHIFM